VKAIVEPLEGNKVKLSIEVEETEFDKAIDAAFRKIAREVRIPGFRPGKAPRKVLERRFGHEVGREQALQDSLPEYYSRALREQDVDAIAPPDIDITAGQDGGPLTFDAIVEVRPEVEVAGYEGLRVTLDRPEVTDEEVQDQIDRMRQVQATLVEVDRPAQDDDVLTIDITGSLDGEVQDGLTATDYSYTVGSGSITPEVDEQLRGSTPGDILAFDATHPDQSEARQLQFRVLVKQVNRRELPEADDAWASENSEFDTIDELRESIRERMLAVRRAQAQGQLREKAGEALSRLVTEDPPETLVRHEVEHRKQDVAMRLQAQGIDVASEGGLPDEMTQRLEEAADKVVRVDLALRAVADAEDLDCTDDELGSEIASIAEQVGQKPRRVFEDLERGGQLSAVRSDVKKRKALDWLLERVEIVDPEGQPIDRAELEGADLESDDTTTTEGAGSGRTDGGEAESSETDGSETESKASEE
jgi:trigger factor